MNAKATAAAAPQRYFVNAVVDFALIGGLSIISFVALRSFYTGQRTQAIIAVAAVLLWLCNWPHFAATSYRLYHSRDNIRQYPITALVIPWLIVIATIASFAYPLLVAPYFVKLFLVWSPYHFSGQSVGITMIYARRNGFFVGRWQRLAISTFIFSTFISQTVRTEVHVDALNPDFFGVEIPIFGLPHWTVWVTDILMYGAGAVFLLFVALWSIRNRRWPPIMVLLPGLTQYVWFVQGPGYASFQEFVPFFHSLQYLFIAWCMQLKEKMDVRQTAPSAKYVRVETVRWGVIIFLLGARQPPK